MLLLAACGSSEAPDLILHNAKIFTASGEPEWAEALAAAGTHIVEIGSSEAVLASAGPNTHIVDIGGRVHSDRASTTRVTTCPFYRIEREIISFGDGPRICEAALDHGHDPG